MGIFRRSKQPVSVSTGHPVDDELLARLGQLGDLNAPRHWVHYLYFADETAARGAAEVVASAGWTLRTVDESAAGGPEWVVIADQHDVVLDAPTVQSARTFFETVAAQWPGGDYDGWEASA